jgi:hypothetical protein
LNPLFIMFLIRNMKQNSGRWAGEEANQKGGQDYQFKIFGWAFCAVGTAGVSAAN